MIDGCSTPTPRAARRRARTRPARRGPRPADRRRDRRLPRRRAGDALRSRARPHARRPSLRAQAVVEAPPDDCPGAALVIAADTRRALPWLAAAFHGYPARGLRVIGVTGTDGKTTTCHMIHALLEQAGSRTGLLSTVGARIGAALYDTGLHTTTPGSVEVQALLAEMRDGGARYVVLETTSHALAQERTAACEYDVAVVTNVTPEHLDYHGTLDAYRATKARLFAALASHRKPGQPKIAVLNADDPGCALFREAARAADVVLTYALDTPADVRALSIDAAPGGQAATIDLCGEEITLGLPLPGRHNVANALAALAVGHALGAAPATMRAALEAFSGVPGRWERVEAGQPFGVVVDFAHTPNALRALLAGLRAETPGRLIAVFGCAGERDARKRPEMGRIAAALADLVVLTSEDPRCEDPEAIVAAIAAGCEDAGAVEAVSYWRVMDRAAALRFAVDLAAPGDTVVATGKGHEASLCIGTTEHPWDERTVLQQALARQGYAPGSAPPPHRPTIARRA
ncbi:MAG: UDP-N-acetylmuramoyl-L-alanyl-D-glutamate--2,6-diaminopimelate ligase [Chloroflexi bacterium]|nr:UDP-N-acetylmuramoyl-L-alanyl-D-glutamate--2,6-diaminopimelate ligase [Chloroflexota bacterium]